MTRHSTYYKNVFVVILLFLAVSCVEQEEYSDFTSPSFDYFAFLKDDNPELEKDVIINLEHYKTKNAIDSIVPHLKTDSLVAVFSGNFSQVMVGNTIQNSGQTVNNFSHPINYTLWGTNGNIASISFNIVGYNGIPRVFIQTENNYPVLTKEYQQATITIDNCPMFDSIESVACKIKGRGNATFGWDKKPYKIKFAQAERPFGFPENKEWVLLALWNDKSLLREFVMADLSRRIGEPFTINTQYVDLFLNDEYRGTYLFVDQVEKGTSRIDVNDNGFIIEDDYYYLEESQWFTSYMGYNYSFKYPKICTDGNVSFIKKYIDNIERELLYNDPDIFNSIDVKSFARFFIVNELLANWEPNLYYYLPSHNSKLQIGPLWDFEWSLGLAENGNPDNEWGWFFPPKEPSFESKIWEKKKYFSYLIKKKVFIDTVKSIWDELKKQKNDILNNIISSAEIIRHSQQDNFNKWPILGTFTSVQLIAFNTWDEEVFYLYNFMNARFDWFDGYLNEL